MIQRILEAYLGKAFSPAVQAAEIADPASTFLLTFDGSSGASLVGYAHLVQQTPDVQLKRLYVDAAYQGRGLAALLLSKAFEDCRQKGCSRIWLTVWAENHRAISFYRKSGFSICGSETFMLGTDAQTDHVMEADRLVTGAAGVIARRLARSPHQ